MPIKDPEKRKEYNKKRYDENKEKIKEYRENNKEKIKENKKKWYEKNKEKMKEYQKKLYEANKEKINERHREYKQTEQGKKVNRISRWKYQGIISDDYDSLYDYYINCKNCEECNVELIEGNGMTNHKHLDHDHETGLFRNVLCGKCNIKRK